MILHSKPWITESDIAFVTEVLKGGMVAQGDLTELFEKELSQWVGALDGVAVGSAAGAIVLALRSLEVGESDEVILPTYVCPSVLDAVVTSGCIPVLCDVGENWIVTEENIQAVVSSRSKAVIVPHMYGIFADISSLKSIGLPIIEDCAQAVGCKEKRPVAGDISIFSFHPTKCLTTGEGGIAVTSNPFLLKKMKGLQGKSDSPKFRIFSPMSNINAALGLAQLGRYSEFLSRRAEIANEYVELLKRVYPAGLPVDTLHNSMFFRFPLRVEGGFEDFEEKFEKLGVCVRRGVDRLLHRLMDMPDDKYPMSVKLFNSTLSIPIYPALSRQELDICKSAIEIIFAQQSSQEIVNVKNAPNNF